MQDFSAVASIDPGPEVSGLLHGTAVYGVAAMPPLYIFAPPQDGSSSVTLNISVASSIGAFPPISRQLRILFCPAGQFYEPRNGSCLTCPVGSW